MAIVTALPILTLINMGMQMKNMKASTFHTVLQNTVLGAIGMLLFYTGLPLNELV